MHQVRRKLFVFLTAAGLALVSIGCPRQDDTVPLTDEEPSPEAEPESEHLGVIVELQRYDVMDWAPPAGEAAGEAEEMGAMGVEEAAMAEAADEEPEGEEEPEQGPRAATILFSLLVRFEGRGEAPEKVEAELVHSDSLAGEKGRYREWLITHEMKPAEERMEALEFEIEDYEEGDAFSVELGQSVPAGAL